MINEKTGGPVVSYQTAIKYHRGRRPSIDYLARVSDTFRVSLDWLIKGEGPMRHDRPVSTPAVETVPSDGHDPFEDVVVGYGPGGEWILGSRVAQAVIPMAHRRRVNGVKRLLPDYYKAVGKSSVRTRVAQGMGRALRAAVDALGVEPADLTDFARADLITAFSQMVCAVERARPAGEPEVITIREDTP